MTCVRLINKLQNEEYYDNKKGISECHAQHNKAKRLLFKILNDRIVDERYLNEFPKISL